MEGLSCKNLSKTYKGKSHALKGVSFDFSRTGIFSMIGRNGAGKTTLIRILATELMPSFGTATVNGIDAIRDANKVREMIAIVPQEARAVPWLTPRQTILCYLLYRGFSFSDASKRVSTALKRLDLLQYENTLNRKLSGGTKRKVLVATVLASEAKVIFLDEPTTGLDPISRADLWNFLKELKKDYTIFLTTHYLEEAEHLADSIGIMDKGKLLAIGSMDELRKRVGQEYSVRIMQGKRPKSLKGFKTTPIEGGHQIMTSERKAFDLSNKLIKEKVKFSINPVSLEDIFYYIVRRPITSDDVGGGDDWW